MKEKCMFVILVNWPLKFSWAQTAIVQFLWKVQNFIPSNLVTFVDLRVKVNQQQPAQPHPSHPCLLIFLWLFFRRQKKIAHHILIPKLNNLVANESRCNMNVAADQWEACCIFGWWLTFGLVRATKWLG